jgi:hypothetical protein
MPNYVSADNDYDITLINSPDVLLGTVDEMASFYRGPERWYQGGYGLDAAGCPIGDEYDDEMELRKASCLCLAGVMECFTPHNSKPYQRGDIESVLEESIKRHTGGMHCWIPDFNDHPNTTFLDVLRVLSKARMLLKGLRPQ